VRSAKRSFKRWFTLHASMNNQVIVLLVFALVNLTCDRWLSKTSGPGAVFRLLLSVFIIATIFLTYRWDWDIDAMHGRYLRGPKVKVTVSNDAGLVGSSVVQTERTISDQTIERVYASLGIEGRFAKTLALDGLSHATVTAALTVLWRQGKVEVYPRSRPLLRPRKQGEPFVLGYKARRRIPVDPHPLYEP
jgi:hypothetical protein